MIHLVFYTVLLILTHIPTLILLNNSLRPNIGSSFFTPVLNLASYPLYHFHPNCYKNKEEEDKNVMCAQLYLWYAYTLILILFPGLASIYPCLSLLYYRAKFLNLQSKSYHSISLSVILSLVLAYTEQRP